ncbi:cyclic nucleotide-binding domain-containing protein [Variovorax sp. HJSM1_2]|uniref:cyclic nucleotide-binding domain-containing protein n=1 Tax=Variovorax sp. HJSM1_2 TaxID=3366263 RepID=UPI003BBF6983
MPDASQALVRSELLWLAGMATLLALALQVWRPALRSGLRASWVLLLLTVLLQSVAVTAAAFNAPLAAELLRNASTLLTVWAVIQIATLALFRWMLPGLGLQVPRIAHDLSMMGLSLGWLLLWLRLLGVDASQLFATSAVLTAVLAFAMQDTLGNIMGGVMLQLDHSLRVGEWVYLDELSGRVVDVRWRYTEILTRNRETVVVPNSWLMKNRFRVLRRTAEAPLVWRRWVYFNVDSHAAPSQVLQTLENAVVDAGLQRVATQPPPNAVLLDMSPGFGRYGLRYWLTDPQFDDPSDSAVRIHALAALAREGIRLGMPLEERLMMNEDDNWRSAGERRENAKRLAAIRSVALFASLSEAEHAMLASHLVHAPFAAGGTITRQGAVAHWLYLIVRGEAEVVIDGPQGRTVVAELRDGNFFGEMGLLTGAPRSATVIARTDVECYRLDKEGFAEVLNARPDLAQEVAQVLAQRKAATDARLEQSAASNGQTRPADLLQRMRAFFALKG